MPRCKRNPIQTKLINFLFKFGRGGSGNGQFNLPFGVAVNARGNIIVADYSNRIQVFDSNGNFLFTFGSFGSGDGQVFTPIGVTVNAAGNIIVADTGNNRIQVFTGCPPFSTPNLNVQMGGRGNNFGVNISDPAVCIDAPASQMFPEPALSLPMAGVSPGTARYLPTQPSR